MKKMMLLVAIVLVLFACKKSNNEISANGLTPCLETKFAKFKTYSDAISVLTTLNNGEQVYKFRVIEGCGDGEIYNENCIVVCCTGRCSGPRTNCPDLDYSEWEIIWEK
jgi:hypothetical protein